MLLDSTASCSVRGGLKRHVERGRGETFVSLALLRTPDRQEVTLTVCCITRDFLQHFFIMLDIEKWKENFIYIHLCCSRHLKRLNLLLVPLLFFLQFWLFHCRIESSIVFRNGRGHGEAQFQAFWFHGTRRDMNKICVWTKNGHLIDEPKL